MNDTSREILIDPDIELTTLRKEMYSVKRQLRQRTALFSIFLSQMGGTTFEFDLASNTAYFTMIDENNVLQEKIVHNFRKWIIDHVKEGSELMERLNRATSDNNKVEPDRFGTVEGMLKVESGEYRWHKSVYQVMTDENGEIISLIGYFQDIHEEVEQRESLENQALRDSMTELYNRATTERLINEKLELLGPREKGVLFLLDIDNFKQINDKLGHLAGDNYLKGVSRSLKGAFRSDDVVGRLGGDEFAVFIKGDVTIDLIEKYGQRLIHLFLKVPCKDDWQVTCSIGIAATGDSTMTYERLLANADEAMYRSKARGKNRFYLYGMDQF